MASFVRAQLNLWRWIVLLLGPVPIMGCAIALGRWAEPLPAAPIQPNDVFIAESAHHAERPRKKVDEALLAECEEKALRLNSRLGDECHVIVRSPFIIGGDLTERELARWFERTIDPAAVAMNETYFEKRPDRAITVLLFSGKESYNEYAEMLFGDRGISIYGYYKPLIRTLIMNIGTGGGTLVHELTHALIDYDFPEVPDWFNEGLASLHEQCRFERRDGMHQIIGLENWRLSALQQAIEDGNLRSLESLITDDDFRGGQVGLNYAQARYFCMYLQQENRLADFYREFRDGFEEDPTGLQAARAQFDGRPWDRIDRSFQDWVLTLRF